MTPILFNEIDGKISIDLETLHYCRNFENVLSWEKEYCLPVDENVGARDWRSPNALA